METVRSSESSVKYRTRRRHIAEDGNILLVVRSADRTTYVWVFSVIAQFDIPE
jgi:hypothetical protein